MKFFHHLLAACAATLLLLNAPAGAASVTPGSAEISPALAPALARYQPRFGRTRPVIAVIGENGSARSTTELTDFVVPYSVLARSGLAQVIAVATAPGALHMRPAFTIEAQATTAQFDQRYPDGADYVIVPAVGYADDARLLAWLSSQHKAGATLVSICDGALVLANGGFTRNHRATAHWDTQALRDEKYPDTHWVHNLRYVGDDKIISSAGISAALPLSLALVEAIGGHDAAAALARQLGVTEWGTEHDSDIFLPRLGVNLHALAATLYTNRWWHAQQRFGVPLVPGIDELTLALSADAYSRTGRSQVLSTAASAAPVVTANGLLLLPDRVAGAADQPADSLPSFVQVPAGLVLDQALADIAGRYGAVTAYGVALSLEYPGFQP